MNRWMLLMSTALGCGDGFATLVEPSAASVIGRVVFAGDSPAESMPVHLAVEGERRTSVFTAADGSFRFEDAPVGAVQIVAHDGRGDGAYRELNVYGGGENDAGTMTVDALRLEPRVLDVRGIGYEERAAVLPDGSNLIAIARDGATLAAIPAEPSPITYPSEFRLVRSDPDTRRILDLTSQTAESWLAVNDRVLLFNPVNDRHVSALDVATGSIFYVSPTEEQVSNASYPSIWPTENGFLIIEHGERSVPVAIGFDGSRREGAPLPENMWSTILLARTERTAYLGIGRNWRDPFSIVSLDLETAAQTEIAASLVNERGPYVRSSVLADGVLYLVQHTSSASISELSAIDLATKSRTSIYSVPCSGEESCLRDMFVDGDITLLEHTDAGRIVRIHNGIPEPVIIDVDPGSSAELCLGPNAIRACYLTAVEGAYLRIETLLEVDGFLRWITIDVMSDRVSRVLDGALTSYGATAYDLSPALRPGEEILWARDESGFSQLSLGPRGGELASFRRLTHLYLDHGVPLLPHDRHVYYTLRDPVHGGLGVFRVSLEDD